MVCLLLHWLGFYFWYSLLYCYTLISFSLWHYTKPSLNLPCCITETLFHKKRHPDKVQESEKVEAEKMFQDISEAYEVLSDNELRGKYDRGEAVFENQGNPGGGHHMDPRQFFQQQHFRHGGGGGGQRMHFNFG